MVGARSKGISFGFSIEMGRKIAKLITDHATLSRYPDNMNEWSEEDAKLALDYAKLTLDAVRQYFVDSEKGLNQNSDSAPKTEGFR